MKKPSETLFLFVLLLLRANTCWLGSSFSIASSLGLPSFRSHITFTHLSLLYYRLSAMLESGKIADEQI